MGKTICRTEFYCRFLLINAIGNGAKQLKIIIYKMHGTIADIYKVFALLLPFL